MLVVNPRIQARMQQQLEKTERWSMQLSRCPDAETVEQRDNECVDSGRGGLAQQPGPDVVQIGGIAPASQRVEDREEVGAFGD